MESGPPRSNIVSRNGEVCGSYIISNEGMRQVLSNSAMRKKLAAISSIYSNVTQPRIFVGENELHGDAHWLRYVAHSANRWICRRGVTRIVHFDYNPGGDRRQLINDFADRMSDRGYRSRNMCARVSLLEANGE